MFKVIVMKNNILILAIICLCSCNPGLRKSDLLELKPLDALEDVMLLSEIADSVSYLQLDHTIMFPAVPKLYFTDDFMVAQTKEGVLKYDFEGNLVGRIGRIGQGPGEYNQYVNLAVDTMSKRIYVSGVLDNMLHRFTFDGLYLGRKRIDLPDETYSLDLRVLGNKLYYFFPSAFGISEPYFWIATDTCGNVIEIKQDKQLHFSEKGPMYGGAYTSSFNESLLYFNLFNDTVFRITEDTVSAAFLFAKDGSRLPKDRTPKFDMDAGIAVFNQLAEMTNYLFFSYYKHDRKGTVFGYYDKKNCRYRGARKIKDDLITQSLLEANRLFHFLQHVGNDYLVISYQPEYLQEEVIRRYNIDVEGNPVLIIVRLKKR